MIAQWMLAAVVFAAFVATAAWALEWALRASGRQGRWPWLAALAAGALWPALVPLVERSLPFRGGGAVTMPGIQVLANPGRSRLAAPVLSLASDRVMLTLWGLALALLTLRLARAVLALHRVRRDAEPRVVDGVPVLVGPMGPAAVGILAPSVLVPPRFLDMDDSLRGLALRHEVEHCRARDTASLFAAALVTALLPWNAPLWWIARRVRLAVELDCDARVLATGANVRQYGRLLLFMAQRGRMPSLAPMLVTSSTQLERRIATMRARHVRPRRIQIAAALALAVVATVAACSARVGDGIVGPAPAAVKRPHEGYDGPFFEFQVDKPAQQVRGTGRLHYPDSLRMANVEGEVLAQFLVDADGHYEPGTFKDLKSTHYLFAQAVKEALPSMTFTPAIARGHAVKQLIQQPFTFSLGQ